MPRFTDTYIITFMGRTAQFNPSVDKIRWKSSHKNCSSYIHGEVEHGQRRELEIKFFTSHSKGKAWGYAVTLQVIYARDPRKKNIRAWVNAGQLRLLPEFIKQRLLKHGIDYRLEAKQPRFAFYRVASALWGSVLDAETDCHHKNGNCLDDRFNNLEPLHKDEHALLHMANGDVEETAEDSVGFFDYRIYSRIQSERAIGFAMENARRKEIGLEPITRTNSFSDSNHFMQLALHRQLRQRLLG